MPNDLEDFLRRAAARRQAGQTQSRQATSSDSPPPPQVQSQPLSARPAQQPARPAQPPGPDQRTGPDQCTGPDRREPQRWETPVAEDVVLRAELVADEPVIAQPPHPAAQRARAAADRANRRRPPSPARQSPPPAGSRSGTGASQDGTDEITGLLELLRNPQGVRQAVLLREILDRPTDRW